MDQLLGRRFVGSERALLLVESLLLFALLVLVLVLLLLFALLALVLVPLLLFVLLVLVMVLSSKLSGEYACTANY